MWTIRSWIRMKSSNDRNSTTPAQNRSARRLVDTAASKPRNTAAVDSEMTLAQLHTLWSLSASSESMEFPQTSWSTRWTTISSATITAEATRVARRTRWAAAAGGTRGESTG